MTYIFNYICLNFRALLICLLFFHSGKAQYNFSEVDQILDQRKTQLGGNVVTMVWKDGKIIYQKEIGEFNSTTQEPIASSSKWLTAALVMVFVDQGKLSLDDPVSKYLPIFRKYAKGYLTVRHCLSQTTGLEHEPVKLLKLMQKNKFGSLEEEVNYFASNKEIKENPGKQFYYGNIGLNIAGRVLEIVGKKSFDRLMTERIIRPLQMKKTTFSTEYAINPSGGALSTAADYIKFLSMLLNKGVYNGKQILSEKSVNEMQKNHIDASMIVYAPKVAQGFTYGLGEWIQETDKNGNSTVISSPGLFGTWPFIDKCRNYGCIIFVKNLLKEERRDIYLEIKDAIDKQIATSCGQ